MKYLFVIPSWSYRGGEKIFISLATSLISRGNEVIIIAGRKEEDPQKINKGIKVFYPKSGLLKNNLLYILISPIVQLYLIKKHIKGTDWIVSESNFCLHASVLVKLITKTKLCWYVMAYEDIHFSSRLLNYLWEMTFGILERFAVKHVDIIVSLAPRVQKSLKARFSRDNRILNPIINLPPTKISKVRLDLKQFFKSSKVLFLPAHLHWKKNQELAINLLFNLVKSNPDMKLVLAGTGPDEGRLRELTAKLNLSDRIKFCGVIKDENLEFCYRNSTSTLVCSTTENEGLSLTAFESILRGTPVVVSNKAGVSSILVDNKIDYVCEPNVKDFSRAINLILLQKPNYSNARKLILRNYSPRSVYNTFVKEVV